MSPKYNPGDIVYRPVHDYFDDRSTSYVESWRIEDVYKEKDRQEPYTNIAYLAIPVDNSYIHPSEEAAGDDKRLPGIRVLRIRGHIWEHEVYATEKEAWEKLLELLSEDINQLDIKRAGTMKLHDEIAARINELEAKQ